MPASTTHLPHPRRAVEVDGTVHAARYAGDRRYFTTACVVYPAPQVVQLDQRPDRDVTCSACIEALPAECPGIREYEYGLTGRTVHRGCCPASF
ncbi:hypothetical protein AB0H73_15005 [Streptomyces olivoreticuli]